MFDRVMRWWCRTMHNNVLYPVHGKYICAECLREWPVPWEERNVGPRTVMQPQYRAEADVVVTAPERDRLLIRLPLGAFRSAPAERLAERT